MIFTDAGGRPLVDVEQFVAALSDDLDRLHAELHANARRHEGEVRRALEAEVADITAAARERLAHQADALRQTARVAG